MDRGGNYRDGSGAGVFNFNRNWAGGNANNSFRSVLSLKLWINDSQTMFFSKHKVGVFD